MSNFDFLRQYWPASADMASLAENYLYTDPNSTIMKLGMFAERLVLEIFAFENQTYTPADDNQARRIRILKREGLLPNVIDNYLYVIRKKRNDATHEYLDSVEDAKAVLTMAYRLSCWFMEVYGNWDFVPTTFVLPLPPVDYSALLAQKDDVLAEKDTALAAKEAEIASLKGQITSITTAASSTTRHQRQLQSEQTASNLDATESEVRQIIDAQLRAAGRETNTLVLCYIKGTRPPKAVTSPSRNGRRIPTMATTVAWIMPFPSVCSSSAS